MLAKLFKVLPYLRDGKIRQRMPLNNSDNTYVGNCRLRRRSVERTEDDQHMGIGE